MEDSEHISDDLIEPKNQFARMAKGIGLMGAIIAGLIAARIGLGHLSRTTADDHEGHFFCLAIFDHVILIGLLFCAFLYWLSGRDY